MMIIFKMFLNNNIPMIMAMAMAIGILISSYITISLGTSVSPAQSYYVYHVDHVHESANFNVNPDHPNPYSRPHKTASTSASSQLSSSASSPITIYSNETLNNKRQKQQIRSTNFTRLYDKPEQQMMQTNLMDWSKYVRRRNLTTTTTTTTRRPNPHHVLIGFGKKPLEDELMDQESIINNNNVTTTTTTLFHDAMASQASNRFYRRQSQYQHNDIDQQSIQQQQPLPYYQCDSIIYENRFIIESPEYPAQYPINRICSYYIGKNGSDICQIEVSISDMDIEDTAQCTSDYLDLGGGGGGGSAVGGVVGSTSQERLCGLMLRNSRRIINFPSNATHIRLTFHSDSKNDRPYRGFSAEVQQLANSCQYPLANGSYGEGFTGTGTGTGGNSGFPSQYPIGGGGGGGGSYPSINPNNYPIGPMGHKYPVVPPVGTGSGSTGVNSIGGQYPYSGEREYINPARGFQYPGSPGYGGYNPPGRSGTGPGYGQRLYPPMHPPYYNNGSAYPNGTIYDGRGQPTPGVIYDYPQPPRPSGVGMPGTYGGNKTPVQYPVPGVVNNSGPIYLASYCDVYLGDYHGEIRSPNYPFGYPVNHSCIYTVKKASPDVCQIEMIFHHFDIQTPNTKKDMTDNCYGDYIQMPDSTRLCGYYTQSMSGDYRLKKYYTFPESSDYMFMQFYSDHQPTPDGSGFWIEMKQLPNTCPVDNRQPQTQNCDRVIYSQTERIISPNYPQFYGARQQCVYFIQPMDRNTCEFEVDLIQFQLESTQGRQDEEQCRKDFLQLPDRHRICGQNHKFRRIFQFPQYHDRTAMLYFHSDDHVEDRGFEMIIRQLPNSCTNYTGARNPIGGTGTGGNVNQPWNTNVYIPSNDPNIPPSGSGGTSGPYLPPTPVYTYDNRTGGLQPYQPPIRPPGGYFGGPSIVRAPYPSDYGARKNTGPWIPGGSGSGYYPPSSDLPNVLNDPRNVDPSGTIPLYFANGTLATRIPPMKPVDMIPFLKKGKTFYQKGSSGRSFPVSTAQDISAIISNRYPGNGRIPESEIYQSSARLRNDDSGVIISEGRPPRPERIQAYDPSGTMMPAAATSAINIAPSYYNCDQVITRPVEYIRSPNFPGNYPPLTRCIYSIRKSDMSVCQIRLHVLSMDLEYTTGCRNDYLQIESTGEKICGHFPQPEQRQLNYYSYANDIRLIFNSDRQKTASGFEVRIEQLPNSCDELINGARSNVSFNSISAAAAAAAAAGATGRSFQDSINKVTPTPSMMRTTTPLQNNTGHSSAPPMISTAQALTIGMNGTNMMAGNGAEPTTLMMTTLMPSSSSSSTTTPNGPRICRTTSMMESYLESDNFPLEYPSQIDCLFKIFRANRLVCRLELNFEEFNVGEENLFGDSISSQLRSSRNGQHAIGECLNDFLEIDGIRYCGHKSGQHVAINFPKILTEIQFRFISTLNGGTSPNRTFNGFRIKVKQIDENCRRSSSTPEVDLLDDGSVGFSPAIIESCPKLSNNTISVGGGGGGSFSLLPGMTSASGTISEDVVKIQSPQFGLPSSILYEPFLDCYYVIQKSHRSVCALEIRFEIFSLEESRQCMKDFLEVNQNLRLCGKLPMDTIRVFDFYEDRMLIHFHTDADHNEQGFAMILRQIRC